jgi:hypothetical protein
MPPKRQENVGGVQRAEPQIFRTRPTINVSTALTAHVQMVNNDGCTLVYGYTAKLDGKDYPSTGQVPRGLTLFP